MSKLIDITDRRFGRLVVKGIAEKRENRVYWLCRCDCGNTSVVLGHSLKIGDTKSCGCLGKEHQFVLIHGRATNPKSEYKCWKSMRERCLNPKHPAYKDYGGRGITVCERWGSFENFLVDMGERPSNRSLDRINNDGNYEPSNCRWATWKQQCSNRRRPAKD